MTYQLITQEPDYAPFSNTGYSDGRGGRYNSLENMHNIIHALVGNGGHMVRISRSASDAFAEHSNADPKILNSLSFLTPPSIRFSGCIIRKLLNLCSKRGRQLMKCL